MEHELQVIFGGKEPVRDLANTVLKSLPDTKGSILNENNVGDKKKIKVLEMKTKGIRALVMALETPKMMNKIMLEQQREVE